MDIILEFKKAAKALQEDQLYLALNAARKANDEDETLQKLIGEFNLVRMDLNNEIGKEDKDETRVSELNGEVSRLYSEIMANKSMVSYNKAKEDVENFLEYVNAVLNAAIDGQDPMDVDPPSHDCGGSCSSCSGCH